MGCGILVSFWWIRGLCSVPYYRISLFDGKGMNGMGVEISKVILLFLMSYMAGGLRRSFLANLKNSYENEHKFVGKV